MKNQIHAHTSLFKNDSGVRPPVSCWSFTELHAGEPQLIH